jgi:ferric-dicitrate binding protein FerR (iron transport regulator)
LQRKSALVGMITLAVLVGAGTVWQLTSRRNDNQTEANKQPTAQSQKGAVGLIEGTVEYYDGSRWQAATTATEIAEGNEVKTTGASRAVIVLDDGSAVRLDANTQVHFAKLTLANVVIQNRNGAVYTRVTPSSQRTFVVSNNEQSYKAMGTAYRTYNLGDKQGVEVFQSSVQTKEQTAVPEGQGYFTKHADASKLHKVSQLDLSQFQNDDFLLWNKSEDEKNKDFADKLGVLKDVKKEAPKVTEQPKPTTSATSAGIKLSGSASEEGIKLSWTATGVGAGDGFKVVYSKKTATPKYGSESAEFSSSSPYKLGLKDGNTYYIRVCAYRPNTKTCENYSNTLTIKTVYKETVKTPVTSGTVTLSQAGETLSWTFGGTAPYGFKIAYNTTGSPVYPGDSAVYSDKAAINLSALSLSSGSTYYIKVCKYTDGSQDQKCVDYSNQIIYTKP